MTGLEKILADIRAESDAAVAEINAKADSQIAAILKKADDEAEAACAVIREQSERQVKETAERAESAAELERRKKLLEARQTLIADVIGEALEKARALPDKQYFDTVLTMMKLILAYYDEAGKALEKGASIEKLVALPVREPIGRFKYTPEQELEGAYQKILADLATQTAEAVTAAESV